MGVSKFVLKLRLYKDEQKSEIFCSSFESTRYRIPSNIKLTFRTFTVFSPKTPKNLLSVHFSIIVNIPDGFTSAVRWYGNHFLDPFLCISNHNFCSFCLLAQWFCSPPNLIMEVLLYTIYMENIFSIFSFSNF